MAEPDRNAPLMERIFSAAWVSPDPWPAEVDRAVKDAGAVPLCVSCLRPQAPHQWFCPRCGYPTNDCTPLMPYLQVFVIGEVLRRGVTGPPERRAGTQLFLATLALSQYSVLAPVYWYWMVRRARGRPIRPAVECDLEEETPEPSQA